MMEVLSYSMFLASATTLAAVVRRQVAYRRRRERLLHNLEVALNWNRLP